MYDIIEMTFEEFESGKGPINRDPNDGKMYPLGLFLVLEDDDNWTGIDNMTGCPFVINQYDKATIIKILRERENYLVNNPR